MALAYWRLKDFPTATRYLQNMDLRRLSPGQQAVFAALARDTGMDNARAAALSVIQEIPPQAPLLPEERAFFSRAGR